MQQSQNNLIKFIVMNVQMYIGIYVNDRTQVINQK